MKRLLGLSGLAMVLGSLPVPGQVIEFESNGLKYQTLSRSGVTVMFAHLPNHVHEYSIIQVAVSNGSKGPYTIRPEDFSYEWSDSSAVRAVAAKTVVAMLMQKGSGGDVVKLITEYEAGVYGNPHLRSTNGYESRRQAALAVNATKLRAAAAASAVALVQTKLAPAESTDGAVFFPNEGKPLIGGRVVVRTNTDVFEFKQEPGRPGGSGGADRSTAPSDSPARDSGPGAKALCTAAGAAPTQQACVSNPVRRSRDAARNATRSGQTAAAGEATN